MINIKKNKYIFILGILIFFAGCNSIQRYKFLSTIFDGVPDPLAQNQTTINSDSIIRKDSLIYPLLSNNQRPDSSSIHEPYKSNECSSCHNDGVFTMEQPDLCYQCHENFNTKFKILHGPVASGACTKCHNPHMSDNKKLVLKVGQQLCFYCHNSKDVLRNEVHGEIGQTSCLDCHNPHGGEDKFIFN